MTGAARPRAAPRRQPSQRHHHRPERRRTPPKQGPPGLPSGQREGRQPPRVSLTFTGFVVSCSMVKLACPLCFLACTVTV